MTIATELIAIESFFKTVYPTFTTYKQTVPKQPAPNTAVIRLLDDSRTLETPYHFRNERDIQIVCFGSKPLDLLNVIDGLSAAFYQTCLIPITGTQRYIRVNSVSFSAPTLTENDLYVALGLLRTETRQARNQTQYQKIMQVYSRFKEGN